MIDLADLTLETVEKALCGREPEHWSDHHDWAQQCHSASLALVQTGLLGPDARVARGACLGVAGQHSWVVVGDPYDPAAAIVDITLWSYDETAPKVWTGTMQDGRHRPHGYGPHIMTMGPPEAGDGDVIRLDTAGLSSDARFWLDMFGPLDARGWIDLWSHITVVGWPAAEILDAFLDQHPEHGPWVPIDRVGMLTDRNPDGLYR